MAIDKTRYSQNQRYEVVLDNGEDASKWSDLLGNVGTIVSGTDHITAGQSISFDKVAGVSADGYIVRPVARMNGVNLDAFSSEGQILSSVYLPSLTDVASFNVALLMSSGTDNAIYYSVPDTDLSSGWNHLKWDCATYTTASGHGVNWNKVKWIGAGVTLDSADDSLSDILVDSFRIQMPTATVNFDPNIGNISVAAGTEIAIKNGDAADELSVDDASTARTSSTNVIPVQLLDSNGKVTPAGELATNAPFTALTDGTNTATIDAADTARTTGTIVQVTQPIDSQGNIITGGGGTSGGLTLYSSPVHFTSAFNTASGIDLTGMSFSITDFSQFVDIEAWDASREYIEKYTPKTHDFDWDSTNGRVLVGDAAFVTGGTFKVSILAEDRTISLPTDSQKTTVLNPDSENYGYETVADVTNEADASSDYYVSMDGNKVVIIQYTKSGGSDVCSLSVWGSIQGDAAAASCEYQDISKDGVDILTHTTTSGLYNCSTMLKTQTGSGFKYLKLNVHSDLSGSDGDYALRVKKTQ